MLLVPIDWHGLPVQVTNCPDRSSEVLIAQKSISQLICTIHNHIYEMESLGLVHVDHTFNIFVDIISESEKRNYGCHYAPIFLSFCHFRGTPRTSHILSHRGRY